MNKITLGKTNLVIEKNGLAACRSSASASRMRSTCCTRRMTAASTFSTRRVPIPIASRRSARRSRRCATKSCWRQRLGAQTAEGFWKDLETSLRTLKTDYIDIYQFHNPAFCPKPGGEDGLYDAALEAKKQGKIRHISITNHRLAVAHEAIDSGLYETLQFPFSYLAGEQEMELVRKCREKNMALSP